MNSGHLVNEKDDEKEPGLKTFEEEGWRENHNLLKVKVNKKNDLFLVSKK